MNFSHLVSRQERITTTKKGSITSVQAVYVPADDLTDPAPATTFAHLDATTVLSRSIAELGIYPAVDPLDSKSRMLDPRIVIFSTILKNSDRLRLVVYRSARSTMRLRLPSRKSSRTTSRSRILLPFWVWTSCLKKISLP